MQVDVVLELRVLHLVSNRKSMAETLGGILSKGDLKAHPHSGIVLPTRPHLLIVPLPMRL